MVEKSKKMGAKVKKGNNTKKSGVRAGSVKSGDRGNEVRKKRWEVGLFVVNLVAMIFMVVMLQSLGHAGTPVWLERLRMIWAGLGAVSIVALVAFDVICMRKFAEMGVRAEESVVRVAGVAGMMAMMFGMLGVLEMLGWKLPAEIDKYGVSTLGTGMVLAAVWMCWYLRKMGVEYFMGTYGMVAGMMFVIGGVGVVDLAVRFGREMDLTRVYWDMLTVVGGYALAALGVTFLIGEGMKLVVRKK